MFSQLRIAGISVFMNSWELIFLNIAHLIEEGITDFFLLDHVSAEDKSNELRRCFGDKATFHFYKKNSPAFNQSVMTTFLLNEARREGFDIALVFDADEFFDLNERTEFLTVRDAVEFEFRKGVQHIRVSAVNYLQHFSVESPRIGAVETLRSSKVNTDLNVFSWRLGKRNSSLSLVVKGLGKTIFRVSAYGPDEFVETGNHFAPGAGNDSKLLIIRHFPYFSKASLYQRMDHGRNLNASTESPRVGEHVREMARLSEEEITENWLENLSWGWGPESSYEGRVDQQSHAPVHVIRNLMQYREEFNRFASRHTLQFYSEADAQFAASLDQVARDKRRRRGKVKKIFRWVKNHFLRLRIAITED